MHLAAVIYAAAYPMLYKIDKNPDWNVFLNMAQEANLTDKSGEQQKVRIHKNPFPTLFTFFKPAPLFTTLHRMLAVIARAARRLWAAAATRCAGGSGGALANC
jgi:hypothetical protein